MADICAGLFCEPLEGGSVSIHDESGGPEETTVSPAHAAMTRRQFLKLAGIAGATVAVGGALGGTLAACGGETATSTSGAGPTAAGAVATTTVASSSGSTASTGDKIKIGMITDFSVPQLVNNQRVLEAVIEGANKRGGWDVGGSKHTLELIPLDGKSEAATSRSAVERLVTQDKVNVIFGEPMSGAWLSVTEGAGTLVITESMLPNVFSPEYKYTFNVSMLPIETAVRVSYLPAYLGKQPKNWAGVSEDNTMGQSMLGTQTAIVSALGYEFQAITYQPGTSDFTAVATKIRASNPDVVILGMTDAKLFQLMRSLRAAAFPGICLCPTEFLPGQLSKIGELTELDGLITGCIPTATDSPNEIAKEQMADYTAKYGAWDDPDFMGGDMFYTYRAAVQKAGSIDANAVATVLAGGFENDGPHGKARMIARPDVGVANLTVCQIMEQLMATVAGGKLTNVQTVGLDDVAKYCATAWAIPMGAPDGAPAGAEGAPPSS
jgi:branched-chain amino acid transport system substrate-binding protein